MRWFALLAAAIVAGAGVLFADFADTLAPALNHAAIGYFQAAARDPVAELNRRLDRGEAQLTFESRGGYLRSVLSALDVPVESQVAVFTRTSLQLNLIEPRNPRTIFFNDQVAVAWMAGGFIEILAQDPERGSRFYTLEQIQGRRLRFMRNDSCLKCHQSDATLGIAGAIVRSVHSGTEGEPMLIYGDTLTDHRTPFESRWGGYYVTGAPVGMRHMGNRVVTDRDRPEDIVNAEPLASLEGRFPVAKYLSPYSDAAALLVFDHQMHMLNLITRFGWEVRAAEADKSSDLQRALRDGAREFVDYLLFVDEIRLPAKLRGGSGFAAKFAARGPKDGKGRSLRDMDLTSRMFRYPCSYMIYSPAFDGLPPLAKEAIYRRLARVLAGEEKDARYARLSAADRRAVAEILRETKPAAAAYFSGTLAR